MFAFALWDRDQRRLFLARDRIGIKPLYYALRQGDLVFASELKALLQHPAVRRDVNLLSLSKYLTFTYVPAPHTILDDVHKLEPGHYLLFDEHGMSKRGYWDIPLQDNPITSETVDDCAHELLELLKDTVGMYLRSDVPVGVFLSGGVDSSTITALSVRASSTPIHTFSLGFEERSYDESRYARRVAQLCGTVHHHETLSLQTAVKMLPEVMGMLDEPFADASILPTYLLSRFTSQSVKVALGRRWRR